MRASTALFALALAAAAPGPARAAAPAAPHPATAVMGEWLNPFGTVRVRAAPCGPQLCGWVVWAAPQALADAAEDGETRLVGKRLLNGFTAVGEGRWRGEVAVPGYPQAFSGRMVLVAADKLKVSGCVLAGLLCRSQIWTRVAA